LRPCLKKDKKKLKKEKVLEMGYRSRISIIFTAEMWKELKHKKMEFNYDLKL
jgi:hypothetical protein